MATKKDKSPKQTEGFANQSEPNARESPMPRTYDNDILTLSEQERGITAETSEEVKWNYLAGAAHRHQILTGVLSNTERTESGNQVAVIDFEGIRILVPFREMLLDEWPEDEPVPISVKIRLERMLGAKVDFIPFAVDLNNRAAVGSRKAAMLERQRHFYASGRVQPGIRIACRVVGVGNRMVTLEACGVESYVHPGDVSHEWFADVADLYSAGDLVVARVMALSCDEETGRYSVRLSIKAAEENSSLESLRKIVPGSNYFGVVTGVKNGVIFVRLQAGANAKTKLYRTKELPSIFDTVSFHVNRVDEENGVAMGLITRIIKRHSRMR